MKRFKVAIALAVVAFLLTAAGSSAYAFWSSTAGVTSTATVASLASSCQNVTSVQNASFEQPVITQSWIWEPNGTVPGWVSTDPVGIEIWQSGFEGVTAPVGNQFVELNANAAGTLSQSISTTPGQILQWSLLHRGRAGVDTMQVLIGTSNSTLVPIRTISDGNTAWGRYSGAYVVPAGQTTTELAFRAISTATGDLTVGNFMDDVSFGSGPCLTSSGAVTNLTNPGSTVYHPGDTVQYATTVANIGSSLSYKSILTTGVLPSSLNYVPGSLAINGVAQTDAGGDDQAEYAASSGVTARLGDTASATAGGTIAQGTSTVVTFQATIVGPVGTTIHFTPIANYVNGLAPLWAGPATAAADVPITPVVGVDVGFTASTVTPTPTGTMTDGVSSAPRTWTFAVRNNGTAVANNTVVHLSAPSGFTATTGPQWTTGTTTTACTTTSATTADCTIGDLQAGATDTVTVAGYAAANTTPTTTFTVGATVTSTSGDPTPGNNTSSGSTVLVADTTAPTVGTLSAPTGSLTGSSVVLNWTAATDNAAVASYNVYRGGVLLANVPATTLTYTDTLLNPSTAYSYTITAVDNSGNVSSSSNTVTPTTLSTFDPAIAYRVAPNSATTYCLSSGATTPSTGAALVLAKCDTTSSFLKWIFLAKQNNTTAATGSYFVTPDAAGTTLSWDLTGSNKADLLKGNSTTQEWKPVFDTGGTFHFVNAATTTRCLALSGTASTGQQLVATTCATTFPSATQSFALTGVTQ
jgi:uncharacterized repeat protein (TIGR01451 family)